MDRYWRLNHLQSRRVHNDDLFPGTVGVLVLVGPTLPFLVESRCGCGPIRNYIFFLKASSNDFRTVQLQLVHIVDQFNIARKDLRAEAFAFEQQVNVPASNSFEKRLDLSHTLSIISLTERQHGAQFF